jgi:hypothetical protein
MKHYGHTGNLGRTEPEYWSEEESTPSINGLFGINDNLQSIEMQLLTIDELKDFGEKIGGSAKDRYNGRKVKATGDGEKRIDFNRLPTDDEAATHYGDLNKKYRPQLSDFEEIGLNKVCARLYLLKYYSEYGMSSSSFKTMKEVAAGSSTQEEMTEYFLLNRRSLNFVDNWHGFKMNDDSVSPFSRNDYIYAALGMNLEKEMGEDFDWQIVVKQSKRGNQKFRGYIDWSIFKNEKVSVETKQRVFNIEYSNTRDGQPIYRVMYSNRLGHAIFTEQKHLTENRSSYRFDTHYVKAGDCYSWDNCFINYADLYMAGLKKYLEEYGNEEKPEKWLYEDKVGVFAKIRDGKDWRNGRNAEPKDFTDTFGFRAVEFGETMPQKERWEHLNRTYDSFMDLCDILNIKPENISLGKTLAICFGSRGRGGKHAPAAHYEPVKKVINLTRRSGAGCLAHEWFHAFDNQINTDRHQFSYAPKDRNHLEYGTVSGATGNDDLTVYLGYFNDATKDKWYQSKCFKYFLSAAKLDEEEGRSKKYWSTIVECAARGFEWYVIKKLADKGYVNEYLAQVGKLPDEEHRHLYPYPHTEDFDRLENIYDGIFKSVRQVKTPFGLNTIQ